MRFAISAFLLAYLLAFWCQLPTYLHFNMSNENKDTEGKNLQSEGSDGDHLENVEGGRDEHILQKLIDQINAEPHYRVVTKEEYDFLRLRRPPTSTPNVQQGLFDGTKPKFPPVSYPLLPVYPPGHVPMQGRVPSPGYVPSPRFFNNSALLQNTNPAPIKLPTFSGSEQTQKGEVSYDVWSYEVRCLKGQWPDHVLLQTVRSSLKSTAREILIPLGESASVDKILAKLEDFYGNVCTPENIMQNFYSDHQQEGESIVTYGSRLEQCISKAVRLGHIDANAKDAMLRSKFWSGLKSSQLRNATRHKYESVKEFHSLLREVRQIEQEENNLKVVNTTTKSSISMATNVDNLSIQNCELEKMQNQLSELLGQMKKLTSRMNRLEETNLLNREKNFNRPRFLQENRCNENPQNRNPRYRRGRGNFQQQGQRLHQQQSNHQNYQQQNNS